MQPRKFTSSHIEELKKKKRKVFKIKTILISIVVISLLVGLYFLSRWKELNIIEVQVEGNKVLDAQKLEDFVSEKISGKYLYLFPKSNFVLTPRSKIKKELLNNFRRIETISFDGTDPNILKIFITEREPLYTWCGESILTPLDKCQFVDYNGYAFDEAPYFSGDVYFRFYGTLDEYYFAKDRFTDLVLFIENLERLDIKPVALYLKPDSEIEIYLSSNFVIQESPKIILNSSDDLAKLFQNLRASIEVDPLKTDFKEKYSSLLYLDLRFVNKVYYKFKE